MNEKARILDLRSDTVSVQSEAMLSFMAKTQVGDDVYEEDPTTRELETEAAQLTGKEAALWVPSGTQGNLIAVLGHTRRGDEILVGRTSHIAQYESGGMATAATVTLRGLDDASGTLAAGNVLSAIREDEVSFPRTGLLCLENTHNLAGGVPLHPADTEAAVVVARDHGIPIHLDGARIFNACAAWGVDVQEYSGQVDSMMFSLAKGFGAPVGAVLVGSKDFIARARKLRKLLGGGMRQTGYMAACGLFALRENRECFQQDNQKAADLAEALSRLPWFDLSGTTRRTNMVYIWIRNPSIDAPSLVSQLESRGIRVLAGRGGFRAVFHNGVAREDVPRIAQAFQSVFEGLS